MEKKKIFWIVLTIVIAVITLAIIINLVLKSDKFNEGKFRVNDAVLVSSAEVENRTENNGTWSISLSQKNKLGLLITPAAKAEIDRIYLTDITVNKGSVVFSQANSENKLNLTYEKQDLDIEYTLDENGQILIELIALNENVLKDWVVPTNIKQIVYDGRMLKTAGIELKDIQVKLKFKLNITEKSGKLNVMKVELKLPNEELLNSGADIRRLSTADFKFKVK